jgi:orotidine-5'-phosphate decarboxylase
VNTEVLSGKDRIIVPLDVPNALAARALVDMLSGEVGMFKVGLELFCSEGPKFVKELVENDHKVFLDLKLHDIPNTVTGAIKSLLQIGVFMCNVHALGGHTMMEQAAKVLRESVEKGSMPLLIGVTILTSMDEEDLMEVGISKTSGEEVICLAKLAKSAGLDGVVASPREVELIKSACGDEFVIVTPGVRPSWASVDDQKRVLTPKEAIAKGATYVVVGRPITKSNDPVAAARRIASEIDELLA